LKDNEMIATAVKPVHAFVSIISYVRCRYRWHSSK